MRRILQWCTRPNALRASILIRILVGSVFLSEGIQKFLFPATLGAGRFVKIGIPAPYFMGPFVGAVEVVFGLALLLGLLTRLSSIPLLIVILVAIATNQTFRAPQSWFLGSCARRTRRLLHVDGPALSLACRFWSVLTR